MTVTVGERQVRTRSDRSGYVDVVVALAGLEPGWHDVTLSAEGAEPVRGSVRVIGADVTFGLVSDIDDTVMITALPRPFIAAWNTFVRHEQARHIVPGMAPLYRTLLDERPGSPDLLPVHGGVEHRADADPVPQASRLPGRPAADDRLGPDQLRVVPRRPGAQAGGLHRLAREFPHIRWILVGDDGQHDPGSTATSPVTAPTWSRRSPSAELTPAEQVLSHGIPVSNEEFAPRVRRPVPVCRAADGYGLLRSLRAARVR